MIKKCTKSSAKITKLYHMEKDNKHLIPTEATGVHTIGDIDGWPRYLHQNIKRSIRFKRFAHAKLNQFDKYLLI